MKNLNLNIGFLALLSLKNLIVKKIFGNFHKIKKNRFKSFIKNFMKTFIVYFPPLCRGYIVSVRFIKKGKFFFIKFNV